MFLKARKTQQWWISEPNTLVPEKGLRQILLGWDDQIDSIVRISSELKGPKVVHLKDSKDGKKISSK